VPGSTAKWQLMCLCRVVISDCQFCEIDKGLLCHRAIGHTLAFLATVVRDYPDLDDRFLGASNTGEGQPLHNSDPDDITFGRIDRVVMVCSRRLATKTWV